MPAVTEADPRSEFVLYPNPPPAPEKVVLLIAFVGLVSVVVGIGFTLIGAWPISGFLLLAVLALVVAFWMIRRKSRRVEIITIDRCTLLVRREGPRGPPEEIRLEPYWARVRLSAPTVSPAMLTIGSRGRTVEIGRFLTTSEKREIANALEDALRAAR
jgi:uncharacterized membrane protein